MSTKTVTPPPPTTPDREFKPQLTLLDAVMLVVGAMIGSGIFIVSADIARTMDSSGGLLLVWAATGVITLFGALSYGELAAAMPRAGGQYIFLREGLNPMMGFLYGWTLFMVIQTGTIAAVAVAFARFLGVFFPSVSPDVFLSFGTLNMPAGLGEIQLGLSPQRVVGILVIAVLTWVNIRGLREAKWVQNTFTFAKTGALLALIALGISIGRNPEALTRNFTDMFVGMPSGTTLILAFGAAMVGSLFSSDAWNNVTFAAAEVKNPSRNLPLALAIGTGMVTVMYLLANLAYLSALPLEQLQNAPQDRVGTLLLESMFGDVGAYLMAAAILVSTFGCINGLILAGARVYYAMAKDRLFFQSVGRLSKHNVPKTALLVQGVWTALLTLTGTYGQLLDYVIFAALIFYALTTLALFRLRAKAPDMPRPYKAFGYPIVPAFYMLSAAAIAVILLIAKPAYSVAGLIVVLIGIPVYFLWRNRITDSAL